MEQRRSSDPYSKAAVHREAGTCSQGLSCKELKRRMSRGVFGDGETYQYLCNLQCPFEIHLHWGKRAPTCPIIMGFKWQVWSGALKSESWKVRQVRSSTERKRWCMLFVVTLRLFLGFWIRTPAPSTHPTTRQRMDHSSASNKRVHLLKTEKQGVKHGNWRMRFHNQD